MEDKQEFHTNSIAHDVNVSLQPLLIQSNLSVPDTSLLRTVSYVPTKFSYNSLKKKPSIIQTLSTTDTKSRPLGANS